MRLELIHHMLGKIDRNRETDSRISAGAAVDRGVDADYLALGVEQRAAGISRIDGSIGLDEIVVVAAEHTALGTDDAGRSRQREAERISDRDHPISNIHAVGVAKLCDRKRIFALDLNEREIGLGV